MCKFKSAHVTSIYFIYCFALFPPLFPREASARMVCDQQPGQPRSCGYVPDGPVGGGYRPPIYTAPPVYQPSPQELQIQRQKEAVRQALATANEGINAKKRGNYLEAIRLLQRALAMGVMNAMDTQTARNAIGGAYSFLCDAAEKRGDIAEALRMIELALSYHVDTKEFHYTQGWTDWASRLRDEIATKREQEEKQATQRQRDKVAASNTQKSIQALAHSLSATPPPDHSQLDFLSSSSPARDNSNSLAVGSMANTRGENDKVNARLDFMGTDNLPRTGGQSAHAGVFGTSTSNNPDVGPAERSNQTTYSSASAQADAAAKDPNRVFDGRPDAAKGRSLVILSAASPSAAANALAYRVAKNAKAMKDPIIARSLDWYLSLDRQVTEKQAQIAAIQKEIDAGKGDPKVLDAQKGTLENDIKRSKADQGAAEKQIKDQVAKLNISIDWNEAPSGSKDQTAQHAPAKANEVAPQK